jgi:hypothetical protein
MLSRQVLPYGNRQPNGVVDLALPEAICVELGLGGLRLTVIHQRIEQIPSRLHALQFKAHGEGRSDD